MTRRGKKLWSILLAIAVVLTTVFANINVATVVNAAEKITVDAEQVQAGKTVIHFKPTSFTTPYVYAYSGQTSYTGAWPGAKMTSEGDGWFSCTIEADSASVIFNDGNGSQEPAAQQSGYVMSGECWYTQGTDGKFSTTAPSGGSASPSPTPNTPTSTAKVTTAPTSSNIPSTVISIKEVTPNESNELIVGQEATLKAEVELSADIDCAYYKYEVKCDGKYVGEHYYSKKSEYTFKPEKEGTYTVEVYAQAHNMDSTTVQKTVTYKVVKGNITTAVPGTKIPTTTVPVTATPSTNVTTTPSTNVTVTPSSTAASSSPVSTTPPVSKTPTTTPSVTKTPSTIPPVSMAPATETPEDIQSVKLAVSKKSPQYRGRAIKLTANVIGGTDLQYKFTVVNIKTKNVKVLQNYQDENYVVWRPGKDDIGSYKIYVYVKMSGEVVGTAKSNTFIIKNKKLSIDSVSLKEKTNYYTIAANTAGGYGTLKYKYIVKNAKGKIVLKTAYSKTRIISWKAKSGTYKVYAYVKDSKTKKTKLIRKTIK